MLSRVHNFWYEWTLLKSILFIFWQTKNTNLGYIEYKNFSQLFQVFYVAITMKLDYKQ